MNKNSIPKRILSHVAISAIILGTATTPAMAAAGDFYDTTAKIHYTATVAGLAGSIESDFIAAYIGGDHFEKELAGGKFLDYNGAYSKFQELMLAGSSASDAIEAVAADPTLFTSTTFSYPDAVQHMAISSVSVLNNTLAVTMTNTPTVTPVIADFAVTCNGDTVSPTALSTTGPIVTLTIPAISVSTVNAVYSVSYKNEVPVVSSVQITPNSVKVGQNFNVNLDISEATTNEGYTWTYTTNNNAIKFIQLNYTSLASESPAEEIITFQAIQAGNYTLHFSLEQPWQGSTSSIQTLDYTINVI
jgi:hypothetical protein